MNDIIEQIREKNLREKDRCDVGAFSISRPQRKSAYEKMRLRLRAGLPGSIVLMLIVALACPLFIGSWPYLVCYIVTQFITLMRVLIAVQMTIAFHQMEPNSDVMKVAEVAGRLEQMQRWNRRYTMFVKLPLTVCVVPLICLPLGLDLFGNHTLWLVWLILSAVAIPLNGIVAAIAFKKMDNNIKRLSEQSDMLS